MPALLEVPSLAAFTEDEFTAQRSAASAFAEGVAEPERRSISFSDAEWVRALIGVLVSDSTKLGAELQQMASEIPDLQKFRLAVRTILQSSWQQRKQMQHDLVSRIRASAVPAIYIQEAARQCASGGGPDGLEIGIDLLKDFGGVVAVVLKELIHFDRARWPIATSVKHINDDMIYVLLRALALADLSPKKKLPLIEECALRGTRSIREAATHALGDVHGANARRLLEHMARQDADPLVRESANEALMDLDD